MLGIAIILLLIIRYDQSIRIFSNKKIKKKTQLLDFDLTENVTPVNDSSCTKSHKSKKKIELKKPDTFFQLILEDDRGRELTLTFKMKPHTVSAKFINLIKKILTESDHQVKHTSWGVYPRGKGALVDLCKSLAAYMQHVNDNSNNGMRFMSSYPNPDNITRYQLNEIHSEFEKIMTKSHNVLTGEHNLKVPKIAKNDSQDSTSLNAVNGLVHALEHVLNRGPNKYDSFITTYLSSKPFVQPIPLDKEEYCLFTLESHFGDLLLGYGTTGKSLYHLYKDNDLKLIENGGRPSPQQFVTSNILVSFLHTKPHAEQLNDILAWTRQNHIEEKLGIDATAMENAHGYIKLGKLLILPEWRRKTENEMVALISPFHKITAYRIMERYQ